MKKFLNWLKNLSKAPVERAAEGKPASESELLANVPANREAFNTIYRELFEDGTLREIYTGKKISVYAVSELHYGVVPFTDRFPDGIFMFLNINEVEAKHVVADEEFFLKILDHKKSIGKATFLNAKTKLFLQKRNAERLAAGTWTLTPEIDAEVLGKKASGAESGDQ